MMSMKANSIDHGGEVGRESMLNILDKSKLSANREKCLSNQIDLIIPSKAI